MTKICGETRAQITRDEYLRRPRAPYIYPCELHNVEWGDCPSCSKFAGECDHGGCIKPATHRWETERQARLCCEYHGACFQSYERHAGREPGTVTPLPGYEPPTLPIIPDAVPEMVKDLRDAVMVTYEGVTFVVVKPSSILQGPRKISWMSDWGVYGKWVLRGLIVNECWMGVFPPGAEQ